MPRRRKSRAQRREARLQREATSSEELSDDLGASRRCADGSFTNSRSHAEKIRKAVEAKEAATRAELREVVYSEYEKAQRRERRVALAREYDRMSESRKKKGPEVRKEKRAPRPTPRTDTVVEESSAPPNPSPEEAQGGQSATPPPPSPEVDGEESDVVADDSAEVGDDSSSTYSSPARSRGESSHGSSHRSSSSSKGTWSESSQQEDESIDELLQEYKAQRKSLLIAYVTADRNGTMGAAEKADRKNEIEELTATIKLLETTLDPSAAERPTHSSSSSGRRSADIKLPRMAPSFPKGAAATSCQEIVVFAHKFKTVMEAHSIPNREWGRMLLSLVPANLHPPITTELVGDDVTYSEVVEVLLRSSVGGCYQSEVFRVIAGLTQGSRTVSEYHAMMIQLTETLRQRMVMNIFMLPKRGESGTRRPWFLESECFVNGLHPRLRADLANRFGEVGYIPLDQLAAQAVTMENIGFSSTGSGSRDFRSERRGDRGGRPPGFDRNRRGERTNERSNSSQERTRSRPERERPAEGERPRSNPPAAGGESKKRTRDEEITPEEKRKRRSEGACFNCGQPDHFARDCPRN